MVVAWSLLAVYSLACRTRLLTLAKDYCAKQDHRPIKYGEGEKIIVHGKEWNPSTLEDHDPQSINSISDRIHDAYPSEPLVVGLNLDPFLSGIIAGYGLAIPVGPIAILVLESGLTRGFRIALSAGVGAASADLIYATVAALAGTFLVSVLAPFASILRVGSAFGLIAIGAWLLYHGRNPTDRTNRPRFSATNCPQIYGMVLGLTLLNPITVTYFTTLILGMETGSSLSSVNATLFICGVFLASLSWQSLLASISGIAHKRLPTKVQAVTFATGNLVIMALGVAILLGLHI
jgi:arginine exporter protein ArgO